ncbi:hypothetical protein N177_3608 [Lutibaculum baratangense AMV1]|uniref:SPOR domain-containing protein n=1 Tax=Lutibaculum baratangense AMV1 TaxID=631454 RepID=V4RJW2_9HYPH|nr:hypothetical protein N177_3608 [Lutibaculum baratangense AMV1]
MWPWSDERGQAAAQAGGQGSHAPSRHGEAEWDEEPGRQDYDDQDAYYGAAEGETQDQEWPGEGEPSQGHAYYGQGRIQESAFEEELLSFRPSSSGYQEVEPHFDDSGHLPPMQDEPERRTGRKTLVFGGLAMLALIGGAGAVAYKQMTPTVSDGPPLVVAAETDPVKTKPDEPGGAQVPNQDRIVFDRSAGVVSNGKSEERIVSREEPVETVPLREQVREAGAPANGGVVPDVSRDEPKRVRTVVVKPDGTIVEEPQAAPAPQQVAMNDAATGFAQVPANAGPVTLYDSSEIPDAPAVSASPSAGGRSGNAAEAAEEPVEDVQAEAPGQSAEAPAARQPEPATPTPPAATQNAGQSRPGQPMQITPQADAPQQVAAADPQSQPEQAQPAAASGGFPAGSYVVQVSSTRSEADAERSAASVRDRYSSVLSGHQTAVERADLGDKGIYYRVSIGPLSDSSSAGTLCSRLKSQGLDCFVRRN